MGYLILCESCKHPTMITDHILRHYLIYVSHYYCGECGRMNKVPEQIHYEAMKLKGELDGGSKAQESDV